MRPQLDDIIAELSALMKTTESLRSKVLLERALLALKEYKTLNEKRLI